MIVANIGSGGWVQRRYSKERGHTNGAWRVGQNWITDHQINPVIQVVDLSPLRDPHGADDRAGCVNPERLVEASGESILAHNIGLTNHHDPNGEQAVWEVERGREAEPPLGVCGCLGINRSDNGITTAVGSLGQVKGVVMESVELNNDLQPGHGSREARNDLAHELRLGNIRVLVATDP